MKKILNIIVVFTLLLTYSCSTNSDFDTDDFLTGNAAVGGLVSVDNPLISYVVGSGKAYVATASVYQGDVQTTSVDIYKRFTNSVTGSISNNELLTTIEIATTAVGNTQGFEFSFTYEQLIAGLVIDGSPLPENDSELNIGDFWSLTYSSNTSNGAKNVTNSFTKVAVGTRYAGVYTTLESSYWNSGALQGGDFNGTVRIIESVNAAVYRHVGLAYWDDNTYYFTVDNTTNVITVMDVDLEGNAVLLNGSPILTCAEANGAFESIPCDDTTCVAIPDDVNGVDGLKLTTGYFRGVGATREFFEYLEKI